jgi:hypothetical protein
MAKKSKKKSMSFQKIGKTIDTEIKKGCGKMDLNKSCTCGSGVYCLGFIGAAVYYIQNATGFWNGVWGLIKALVWPAFLVFEALKAFLG